MKSFLLIFLLRQSATVFFKSSLAKEEETLISLIYIFSLIGRKDLPGQK